MPFARTDTSGRAPSARRDVLAILIIATLARLVLAAVMGLGVDESYAVAISRHLSLSYFDHPPLAFWIAGLTQRVFGTSAGVVLRTPFILLFAGTCWLLYRLTARYWGERAGFYAVLLVNIAPVFSLSTGSWILPDGPLDFALVAAALCLARVLAEAPPPRPAMRWWLAAGACTGVAFLSKYHAVFLVTGALLFVVTARNARQWFRRPQPYIAALVALAFLVPVVWWNASHGWASFRFQGARGLPHHGKPLDALAQNLAGQAAYLLPWLWVPLVWQLARALRTNVRDPARWLLCCLAVVPIALFTLISLGGSPGLPHWPAPGYLMLFPLLGASAAAWETRRPRAARRWIGAAAAMFVLLAAVAASQIATGWISRLEPRWFTHGDPSLEAVDWSELPGALARFDLADGPPAFVATTHWIDAGKAGYALGPAVPVLCLSDDPRHFAFLYDAARFTGRDGFLVIRAGTPAADSVTLARYGARFHDVVYAGKVDITRLGQSVITLLVYRAHGLRRAPATRA